MKKSFAGIFAFTAILIAFANSAFSADGAELKDWAIWHQPAASDMMERIAWFDAYTFWFIIPITIFVTILLAVVMIKFSAKNNSTPSKTTHNTMIEVVWTVAPIIVLVMIAIPSFDLLNRQLAPKEQPDMTIKATGNQWYWTYQYQDESEIEYDSVLIGRGKYAKTAEEREEAKVEREDYGKTDEVKYPYLMAVDNELVVPVNKVVRVLVTAESVIHSFTVPAFGFKIDAVPGRLNETWFKADREGLFYGQCSELCGKDHAFMPIAVRVVSDEQYASWKAAATDDVEEANKALMAAIDTANASVAVAANQ